MNTDDISYCGTECGYGHSIITQNFCMTYCVELGHLVYELILTVDPVSVLRQDFYIVKLPITRNCVCVCV